MRPVPILILILIPGFALLPAPTRADGAPTGDAAFGAELFASLCVSCHRATAEGDDRAPDIRGATRTAIKRATSGMDSMQDFQFDAQDIADVHAYLGTLMRTPLK